MGRYYDPRIPLFTQPDTVVQDYYNPQNLNRYAYVLNNPYKYVDPSGHFILQLLSAMGTYLSSAATAVSYELGALSSQISAYFAQDDINTAIEDPTLGNIAWAGLAVGDGLSKGIPEGAIAKKGVEAAGKAVKSAGIDIVGTSHSQLKPTQDLVSRPKVERFASDMLKGDKFPPIEVSNKNNYIYEGHNRYVASKKVGKEIGVIRVPEGPRGYKDWSSVKYTDDYIDSSGRIITQRGRKKWE